MIVNGRKIIVTKEYISKFMGISIMGKKLYHDRKISDDVVEIFPKMAKERKKLVKKKVSPIFNLIPMKKTMRALTPGKRLLLVRRRTHPKEKALSMSTQNAPLHRVLLQDTMSSSTL